MKQAQKVGILVINLGTPDSTEVADVRRYLREFLSDPRVLDINPIVRWLLLNLIILRTRPAESAHAYEQVWTEEGSPLLIFSEKLVAKLVPNFPNAEVVLAMRYGNPSIKAGMAKLRAASVDRIVVVPLYPQYASSSTGTALDMVYKIASEDWNTPSIQVLPPFYDDPRFLDAWKTIINRTNDAFGPDHVLFSYHGLPERHVQKSDLTDNHCLKRDDCCDTLCDANRHCYRAHCFATTRGLVERLGLEEGGYTVTFQSRLGKDPWIKPYTDEALETMPADGVKRLSIVSPAFVADCLETLEELAMTGRDDFIKAGGEDLKLVPSLNDEDVWVEALTGMIRDMGV